MNIKKWLITKLAGDTTVILNTTILYNHYPIFADEKKKPIIAKNQVIKQDKVTPFSVYASHIFETVDGSLKLKEEYENTFEQVVKDINNKAQEDKEKKEFEEFKKEKESKTNES